MAPPDLRQLPGSRRVVRDWSVALVAAIIVPMLCALVLIDFLPPRVQNSHSWVIPAGGWAMLLAGSATILLGSLLARQRPSVQRLVGRGSFPRQWGLFIAVGGIGVLLLATSAVFRLIPVEALLPIMVALSVGFLVLLGVQS
jgi:hypothetical protein